MTNANTKSKADRASHQQKLALLKELRKSSAAMTRLWNRGHRATEKLQGMRYSGTEKAKRLLAAKIEKLRDEHRALGEADQRIWTAYLGAAGIRPTAPPRQSDWEANH